MEWYGARNRVWKEQVHYDYGHKDQGVQGTRGKRNVPMRTREWEEHRAIRAWAERPGSGRKGGLTSMARSSGATVC